MQPQVQCRHFRGDRPCARATQCHAQCQFLDIPQSRILLIHLGALGAVVRSTALLEPIQKQHPHCHLTWITDSPADRLISSHPRIDSVLTARYEDLLSIMGREYDSVYVVDKSNKAAGIVQLVKAKKIYGFYANETGAIIPATPAATELWHLGLSNDLKFYGNTKPETQLINEALELGPWRRNEYDLPLSEAETVLAKSRWREWSRHGEKFVIGLNTGCSDVIAAKKLSVEAHVELIKKFQKYGVVCVLLGGPEDIKRNQQIAIQTSNVIVSPESAGLRDGLVSVAACDAVVTGDSLGMHMAISQKKWVTAWFGPTCSHEIDFYSRGHAVLAQVSCSPCWKRACQEDVMCYDRVSLDEIVQVTLRGLSKLCQINIESSLSKRPSSETYSLVSPC